MSEIAESTHRPMTPAELREAAQAIADRIGPAAWIDLVIWNKRNYDWTPPCRALVYGLGVSVSTAADTFEEALSLLETKIAEELPKLKQEAIARARARLAELEAA